MNLLLLTILLWLQPVTIAERRVRFALYNSNGRQNNGSSGILVANTSADEVATFNFISTNFSRNRNVADLACKQLGYNHSVDLFGLTMFNDPDLSINPNNVKLKVDEFLKHNNLPTVESLKTWYKILEYKQYGSPSSYNDLLYRLRVGKAIDNIVCDEGGRVFHENCSYSIGTREKKYLLGIVCQPKPDECAIVHSGKFLINSCFKDSIFQVFKCVYSSTYYTSKHFETLEDDIYYGPKVTQVTKVCPNDPMIYQACESLTDNHAKHYDGIRSSFCYRYFKSFDNVADGFQYEVETDSGLYDTARYYIDKRTLKRIELTNNCDGYCGSKECDDESNCNGFRYGFFCKDRYISPMSICDGFNHCIDGEDERDCHSQMKSIAISLTRQIFGQKVKEKNYAHFTRSKEYGRKKDETVFSNKSICIPRGTVTDFKLIHNYTRCSALIQYMVLPWDLVRYGLDSIYSSRDASDKKMNENATEDTLLSPMGGICEFYIDHINCTDPKRGVIPCLINGYPSTVSKFATCVQTPGLCDDGFDNLCVATTRSCYVHKHKLCNGIADCADRSDETSMTCKRMTVTRCYRRYRHEMKLPIPLSWLTDGEKDCLDGEDEKKIWPTCGAGKLTRFSSDVSLCEDIFICSLGSSSFVHFEDLCDGHDQCGHQRLCSKTKSPDYVHRSSYGRGNSLEFIAHCIPGMIRSISHHASSACVHEDFMPQKIFGLNGPQGMIIPETIKDCKNFFGKAYIYLSCSEKCVDQPICPLKPPEHNACMLDNKFKDRVFTVNLNRKDQLTFLHENKKTGKYENNNFQCGNNKCVHREKVCNLVDDCGDASDEENCSNNFACKSPKRFIAIGQKCDGEIHCEDYSDECNEQCTKSIIGTGTLKLTSWTIGGAAVVLNSIKLWKNVKVLATRQFTTELNNKVLTSVIHFGDFVTGSYLLTIAAVDTFVYGNSYCQKRVKWISSDGCAFLGVFSTFGMQMSLYSMTCLSIFRAIGVVRIKKIISKNAALKISLIIFLMAVVSFCQAYIPVVTKFEDFFVNGMTFDEKVKIFPAIVTKDKHIEILREYFGRMSMSAVSTWAKTNDLIDIMFSDQYDGIGRRKIHFYGNDGVCLFKYFVSHDDPQKSYVWINLLINLFCFLIIFICYSKVLFSSKIRGKLVRKVRHPNKRYKDQEETQKYITIIIMTDFFCWIPFIMVCTLHFFQFTDATTWYPISSIVILPINSVINPILYNNYITITAISLARKARIWVRVLLNRFSYTRILQTKLKSRSTETSVYSKETVSTARESVPSMDTISMHDEEKEEGTGMKNFEEFFGLDASEIKFNKTGEMKERRPADKMKPFQRKGTFKKCSTKVNTMEPIAEESTESNKKIMKVRKSSSSSTSLNEKGDTLLQVQETKTLDENGITNEMIDTEEN